MKCLACGMSQIADLEHWADARDVEYKSVPDSFTYYRCLACDALSIDPVPENRLGDIYPPNYYSFRRAQNGIVHGVKTWLDRRWFRRIVGTIPGERLSALDVGGGAGDQLDALRAADSRIARTVIVDLDPSAEAEARSRGHDYVRSRIEQASIAGTFDVILLLNLIEHVTNPRAVLEKVRNLLSPSGIVLIKTPNYASIDARLFRTRNWGGYHCPRHWVLFTTRAFERVIRSSGLRVVHWTYTQGAPFWTVSVLAWLDEKSLVRITPDRPAWMHPLYSPLAAIFAALDFTRGVVSPLSQMTFALARA